MTVRGAIYRGANDPVQGSWQYRSHENLVASDTASTSSAIDNHEVLITCQDDVRLDFNQPASAASPLFLRGDHLLLIERGTTISVIRLGVDDVQVTIKIPE